MVGTGDVDTVVSTLTDPTLQEPVSIFTMDSKSDLLIKQENTENGTQQEDDCFPPITLNGSVSSPKSSLGSSHGEEFCNGSATSSPSSTPTTSSTVSATTVSGIVPNSLATVTAQIIKPSGRETSQGNTNNAADMLLFGQQPQMDTQIPSTLDISSMFNTFFGNTTTKSTETKQSKPGEPSVDNNQDAFAAAAMIDQKAFLQLSHLFSAASQTSPNQQRNTTTTSASNNTARQSKMLQQDSAMQDRKRSYPYTFQYCVLCQKNVHSSKLPCHIRQCHVGKPMFQCPACDFTSTYSKNNVKSHMVSLHGLAGDPISYMDQYAGQVEEFMKKCFPNVRGRGRPVHGRISPVVSTSPSDAKLQNDMGQNLCSSPGTMPKNGTPVSENGKSQRSYQRHNVHHQKSQAPNTTISMPNTATNATNRFNEIYAMAMLGGGNKSPFEHNVSFPQAPNIANDYPLQNLNPLFYIQQLNNSLNSGFPSKLKTSQVKTEACVSTDKKSPQLLNNSMGPSLDDYGVGVEQLFKDFNKNFEKVSHPVNDNNNFMRRSEFHEKREKGKSGSSNGSSGVCSASPSSAGSIDISIPCEGMFMDLEPRYLPKRLKWTVLEGDQLENTVFKTFSNSSELIEKLDLSLFESLLDQSNAFLTSEQLERISHVRQKIGLKSFEIMFAVHRLDLQVLKVEDVRLVETIAPTQIDVRRFQLYEQSNSVASMGDNEQFILQLSKIDRLREKLKIMAFMGCFNERIIVANQQISDVSMAAKLLQNSSEFHTILHILLTCANLINGDFNSQLVEGFRPSRILEICEFVFPTGDSLLDVLADRIVHRFPELKSFCDQYSTLDRASKVEYKAIKSQLQYFEAGQRLVDSELRSQRPPNESLSTFLVHCELETAQFKEILSLAKDQIVSMLQFFGESMRDDDVDQGHFRPEEFFANIAEFSRHLSAAVRKLEVNS
ncbi:formin homology 2 domain-containing protein [Ditylenchus destructor]|nr:formin homology 2 domain-containing protein [Ditylenchus destructor]